MESYTKAFNTVKMIYSHDPQNYSDAKTHRTILYDLGYNNGHPFLTKSFRAVCEHIKTEKNNNELEQAYTQVFFDKSFCQRILKGWAI